MPTTALALVLLSAPRLEAQGAPLGLNPVLFPEALHADAYYAGSRWQDWIGPRPARGRDQASATVEVVGLLPRTETRQDRVQAFVFHIAPMLQRSFSLGEASSVTLQMFVEFMAMNPARINPPSTPSVFYNSYRLLLNDLERRRRILDPGPARP